MDYALLQIPSFSITLFAAFGLIFGSFISLVSYRLVHGGAIMVAHSKCTQCHHNLSFLDLFPVLSWLFNKGHCRYCHAKVSIRYPLTEIATALTFLVCYFAYGWTWNTLILCSVSTALIIMIVVDLEHQIIPDEIQIMLALFSIPYAYFWDVEWSQMVIMSIGLGLFSYGLRYIFWLWKKKEALGLGDVKFFIVAGLYLPFESMASFLFISGMSGVLLGLLWRLMGWAERFPFGPSLAIAFFICISFPATSYQWLYLVR